MITRDEFISAYLTRTNLERGARRAKRFENGIVLGAHRRWAVLCACGEPNCEGWAMISDEGLDHHFQFNAPKGAIWPEGAIEANAAAWTEV